MRAKASMSAPRAERKCAICGKPQSKAFRPFCSKRCARIDLSKWLSGHYAIPVGADPAGGPAGSDDAD
jgi:endogenous inhibitor of DNA gyrase (YacG/DUF329 family)